MASSGHQPTLTSQAVAAARLELTNLARRGMENFHRERFDLSVVAHATRKQYRNIHDFLPATEANRDYRLTAGVFGGLLVDEIVGMCFTPEAVDFLIEHSYNPYVFWQNVYSVVFRPLLGEEVELPATLAAVHKCVLEDRTPFGTAGSTYSDFSLGKLKAAVQAQGGAFDPAKLEAGYAFELLLAGFLLRQKLEDYKQPMVLVVNPMWAHLLENVLGQVGDCDGDHHCTKLVASAQVSGEMLIKPLEGYSAAEIARSLSQGKLTVRGRRIIRPAGEGAESDTVVARVVSGKSRTCACNPVWSVVRKSSTPQQS